jgi:hypothetical protein
MLKGWKGIAEFLKISESTARRWESLFRKSDDPFPAKRCFSGVVSASPVRITAWAKRHELPIEEEEG